MCEHTDLDHYWNIEPWSNKETHEVYCLECGAQATSTEVDWDIDHDGRAVVQVVATTWN